MVTEQELYSHVENAVRTVLNLNGRALAPTTALVGELGAESIDFLDLSCEIEKLVDVQLDFKDVFRERKARAAAATPDLTLADVVAYLKARTAGAA